MPGGYRLRADPDSADVLEFRGLAERARAATSPALAVLDWVAERLQGMTKNLVLVHGAWHGSWC